MSFYTNIPRPKGWSEHFKVIEGTELFTCPCGKENITYHSVSSHAVICKKVKPFFERIASERRNGLAKGPRVSLSKYYRTEEQYNLKRLQYLRILKKLNRRKRCVVCDKVFYANTIPVKTCSKVCAFKCSVGKRDYVASTIKSIATRIANGNNSHPAWNKGLSGDEYIKFYQRGEETLDETKARMMSGFFRKTKLEEAMEEILTSIEVVFESSIFIARRQFDFKLVDHSLVIEVDGDYWHGNVSRFGENLKDFQIENQKQDRIKDALAAQYGYTILRFWESDVHNFPSDIEKLITRVINEDEQAIREIEINYANKGGEHIRCYRARQAPTDC